MRVFHKTIFGFTIIIILSACASKFAPVVSRPDNLVIECETKCKFNIPMNTEIVVARNTNGYDMGKELIKQIPFIGALALSWKSMETAENIADAAIESLNGGAGNVTTTTTTTTTGDTITSGDVVSTETDSSGSGNTTSGDVATTGDTTTTGDTIDSSDSGNTTDTDTTTTTTTNENNNSNNDQSNNSNQGNVPPP